MIEKREVSCWKEFRDELQALDTRIEALRAHKQPMHVSTPLFRGQSNSKWNLATTLERYLGSEYPVRDYFQKISTAAKHIGAVTGRNWNLEPYPSCIAAWEAKGLYSEGGLPLYDFLIFLRHHGFPSPLLDWTASPYVAAYFAFSGAEPENKVSIYAYVEYAGEPKGHWRDEPRIEALGPNASGHLRHYLQQSQYTMCTTRNSGALEFVSHEGAFSQNHEEHDLAWEFQIPARERVTVLRELQQYNLTQYSLFHSEESLLQTIAMNEFLLDP